MHSSTKVPYVTFDVQTNYEFGYENMASKTWSRETSMEYSESNGKQMRWSYICHSGFTCEAVISVYQASLKVS